MAENRNTYDVIQDLIETCRDGQQGYLHAAAHVKDTELKSFFQEQSLERGRFISELQQQLKALGEGPAEVKGSLAAKLHRAWFDLAANLGGGDKAILNNVERGEDAAKDAYQKMFTADLPADVGPILRAQYESVLAAHDRVRNLRDTYDRKAA